eukprot:1196221-Prorocentrum_minimum.AAC.2
MAVLRTKPRGAHGNPIGGGGLQTNLAIQEEWRTCVRNLFPWGKLANQWRAQSDGIIVKLLRTTPKNPTDNWRGTTCVYRKTPTVPARIKCRNR